MPTDALLSSALPLEQRGCNEFVPLWPWDFSLLLLATSAQFLLELCTAVTSGGKENFLVSSTLLKPQQLLQLTAPSHLLCPCWTPWTFPGCPSHLPAQNTGSRVKQVPLRKHQVSQGAWVPVHHPGSACSLCKFIFTTLANQMQGAQK